MSKLRAVPEGPKAILRWEDPPAHSRGRTGRPSAFEKAAEDLKTRPGTWAIVRVADKQGGCSAALNYFRRHRDEGYDYCLRKKPDGRWYVYAVYVGVETDPDD